MKMNCLVFSQYLYVVILFLKYNPSSACDRAEYEINGECCPMCSPGTQVYRHCTEFTSTSCVPCIGSTFINKPNGLITCFPCTVCDQGLGVKTVKECTASSDTVCGVLEGNYCVDPYEGGCRAAEKHTTCKPGQLIKRPGSETIDTVCENCPENSYSNGSSKFCKTHTDCEAKGLSTIRTGSSVFDTECGKNSHLIYITGVILVIILILIAAICMWMYKKKASLLKGVSSRTAEAEKTLGSETTDKRNTQRGEILKRAVHPSYER
ncbi:tumor necrosis factor receptor superfamily member 5-like isoform X1 [Arapaima gigas]